MLIDYINKRKKELNLTNKQLSELSGVPMGTLSKIMAGIIENPKLSTLQSISRALNCTIDDFSDENKIETSLTKEEQTLLDNYRCLNEEGQEKLSEYAQDLVDLGKYKKDTSIQMDKEA